MHSNKQKRPSFVGIKTHKKNKIQLSSLTNLFADMKRNLSYE